MKQAGIGIFTLALALAGCLGDSLPGDVAPPPDGGEDGLPKVLPWGLTDCQYMIGLVPVDQAAVAPHLPEGFAAAPASDMGLPQDPRGEAVVGVEAFECAEGQTLNGTLDMLQYGSVFTLVYPPEELRVDGADAHFVKWDTYIPDAERRHALDNESLPVRDGFVLFRFSQRVPPVGGFDSFTLKFEPDEYHLLHALNLDPLGDDAAFSSFSFAEFTDTPNGLATWRATAENSMVWGGVGQLDVGLAGIAKDILGGERHAAYVMLAQGSFVDASLTLPDGAMPATEEPDSST